jgi:hypothetical protein
MSSNARRFSKSKDDQKLLEAPKKRDRSAKPLVLVRLPGAGRACVARVPVVGEVIWGLVEKYTFGPYPTLYTGAAWESIPCTVMNIRDKDIVISMYIPDELETKDDWKPPSGPVMLLSPRIDNHCGEREKDDPYHETRWNRRS